MASEVDEIKIEYFISNFPISESQKPLTRISFNQEKLLDGKYINLSPMTLYAWQAMALVFLTWTLWLSFFASSKFIGQTQFSQLKLQPLILIE